MRDPGHEVSLVVPCFMQKTLLYDAFFVKLVSQFSSAVLRQVEGDVAQCNTLSNEHVLERIFVFCGLISSIPPSVWDYPPNAASKMESG